MLILGLLVAGVATLCIAAGRLLGRIRPDSLGRLFFGLGAGLLVLDIVLLRGLVLWVAPVCVLAGWGLGQRLLRQRGLR